MTISERSRTSIRPFGVTALGAFFIFGATASGLSALSLFDPGGPLEPIWRLNPHAREELGRIGFWAPVLMTLVSAWCLASAVGFFRGRLWGYWCGIALLVTNLTGDIVNAFLGIEPRAIYGLPVVAIFLWYLSRPNTRKFFAPKRSV